MKHITLISWGLIILTAVLAVVSYIVLPDTVIIQFSTGNSRVTTAPKAVAVLIPTILGAAGAVFSMLNKDNRNVLWKSLLVSAVGIIVFIIMLIVNLIK